MARHMGPGPVFVYESLLNARRWQVYAGRSGFVLVLLVGIVFVWAGALNRPGGRAPTLGELAELGESFFYAIAGTQLSLVMLAAPAATAGAICLDRARGTLLHMMVTDLSDAEIVLGKLAARLAPVFGMIACTLPVAAIVALLGGIEFRAMAGAFAVSLALAVLGCALALTLSVWSSKAHEVLMAVYMAEILWLLALPTWWGMSANLKLPAPPPWFQKTNPFVLAFGPYVTPGFVTAVDYVAFVAGAAAISAMLVGLSIAKMRRVVVAQSGQPEAPRRRRRLALARVFPTWPGPTLDGNPVLWREWHRARPSRMARRIWAVLLVSTWATAAWGLCDLLIAGGSFNRPNALVTGFMLQVVFGFLMLSATAPTSLAEERLRDSLDALMATPLATRSIVVAKWWGAYRGVFVLLPLTLLTAVFFAAATPDRPSWPGVPTAPQAIPLTRLDRALAAILCVADFLASAAVLVSLGLALATWVRRLGRAVAFSVIAYFLTSIGWIFVVEMLVYRLRSLWPNAGPFNDMWLLRCAISLSPIAGPINPIENLQMLTYKPRTELWVAFGIVVQLKALAAGFLLWLTVRTFDRCLGRVPEPRPSPPARKPARLEVLVPETT